MKLLELITFFREGGTYEQFCTDQTLDYNSEVIEIYAEEPLSVDSKLGFFAIEETEGRIQFQSDGLLYHNLFDFYYFLDVIEEFKDNSKLEASVLADKLFSYAIKDA